ncbi:hypothetical protein Bbelb_032060 [Branchiostoma belcheri]|nr:hypothetical protein Bbelb_032060 [Branchiostoma belcheri]
MSVRFAVSSVKEDEDGITNEPASASSPSEASGPTLSPTSPPPRIEIVEYGREPHTYNDKGRTPAQLQQVVSDKCNGESSIRVRRLTNHAYPGVSDFPTNTFQVV